MSPYLVTQKSRAMHSCEFVHTWSDPKKVKKGDKLDIILSLDIRARMLSTPAKGDQQHNTKEDEKESSALSLSMHFTRAQFFVSQAHTRGCTQLPLDRDRLHCILREAQRETTHCLRFLRSSRQVDCARKIRQLSDLCVLIKSLIILLNKSTRSYWYM